MKNIIKKLINFGIFNFDKIYYSGVEKMVKWGKLITAGIAASVVRYLISSGFGYYFQGLYDPVSGLWRAMMTPSWIQNTMITHVILAFIAVFVYAIIHTGLGKKSDLAKKGLKYGLILWILRDFTGSIMTYVFMPVSFTLIGVWLISGLLVSVLNGLIIARIYR